MIDSSQVFEEVKKRTGVPHPPIVYNVENGMIERFLEAIGESNTKWRNNNGQLIAPPTFPLILGFDCMIQELNEVPSLTILHGSTELESYLPIVAGDTLTIEMCITNVREREGKTGQTLFINFEIKCRNQQHELTSICRQLAIIY
ncbi:MAG: MaoC family dehydratase N-terminal domain-containing protein [Dehalococcoidales bacterium]|nr:MaoC family dehydratase N-terminal domain-containing protein [Dehalococcoidales bacterium]